MKTRVFSFMAVCIAFVLLFSSCSKEELMSDKNMLTKEERFNELKSNLEKMTRNFEISTLTNGVSGKAMIDLWQYAGSTMGINPTYNFPPEEAFKMMCLSSIFHFHVVQDLGSGVEMECKAGTSAILAALIARDLYDYATNPLVNYDVSYPDLREPVFRYLFTLHNPIFEKPGYLHSQALQYVYTNDSLNFYTRNFNDIISEICDYDYNEQYETMNSFGYASPDIFNYWGALQPLLKYKNVLDITNEYEIITNYSFVMEIDILRMYFLAVSRMKGEYIIPYTMYFLDECRSQLTGFDYELMSSTLSVAIYSLMTWNMQVKTVGTHSNYIRFYRTGIIGDMPTSWVMHALSLLAGEYDFFGVPNIYNGSLKELYFYPMDTEFMFNNAVFNDFISSGQFEIPNAQTINTPNGPLFVPAGYYNFEYFDYTYNNVTEQGIVVIFP